MIDHIRYARYITPHTWPKCAQWSCVCFQGINLSSKFLLIHCSSSCWTSRLISYSKTSNTFTHFFISQLLITCRQICRQIRYQLSKCWQNCEKAGLRNCHAHIKPQRYTVSNATTSMFYVIAFNLYFRTWNYVLKYQFSTFPFEQIRYV